MHQPYIESATALFNTFEQFFFSFSMEKEMLRFVILHVPCFDLHVHVSRSNSSHIIGVYILVAFSTLQVAFSTLRISSNFRYLIIFIH